MRWYSAFSERPDTTDAAREVCDALRADLGDAAPDLVLAFFSGPHIPNAESLARTLKLRLAPGCLAGASANGVVSSAHEVESGPALTVMAAVLPGVALHPFLVMNEIWAEAWEDAAAFAQAAPGARGAELVLLLGDPFSLDIQRVVAAFNRHAPKVRLAGGMASAAARPGGNTLFLNDWVSREGGFALAFHGAIRADVVVSQGCRPIGPPLEITRADGNLVIELDGQPALERAEQVLRALPEDERERLQSGLYVGRPARGDASGRGDYLIRNLLGADRDRGVVAIGDIAVEREKVRLHVRDRDTAREDLEMLLSPQAFDARAGAVLLFACNGRGQGLFGAPDGDIGTLQAMLGGTVPAGGMFCAGEIGPVGERNHLHGHAASIAILRAGARSPA
jgi:small ligand-binding sensory domain FIST